MKNISVRKPQRLYWLLKGLSLFYLGLMSNFAYTSDQIQYIDVHQAKKMHDQGALFIDTRSWFERKLGIIPNALAIEVADVEDVAQYLITDKSKSVVLYCATGYRASQAALKLKTMGYESIQVVSNGQGYSRWKKSGYPTSP